MVGSASGTGSGKFDRIRIREIGPDPTGCGSATLHMTLKKKYGNKFPLILS